jgi:hypothetical protein
LIIHGSVIRAILDYVYIALKGRGKVTIADAPLQKANFAEIVKITGLDKIVEFYNQNSNIEVTLVDFRRERALSIV